MIADATATAPVRGGLAVLLLLTAACFADDPPTGPDWPQGPHRFLHGQQLLADGSPAVDYGVVVLGRSGEMVTAQGPDSLGRYVALVDGLTPPYMVLGSSGLSAIALDTGEATISLLTHLQAGELLRADPGTFLGPLLDHPERPEFDQFTPAAMAAAQASATALLQDDYGLDLGLGGADFVTTRATGQPGDLMTDALLALGGLGIDPYTFSLERQDEFARCRLESVALALPAGARTLCPRYKETATDAVDPSVTVYRFINYRDDSLVATVRGTTVLGLTYARAGGAGPYACDSTTCTQASITGAPTDTLRPLQLAGTALEGPEGAATVTGALGTADPTWQPPVLVCDSIGKYAIRQPDGRYAQGCAYTYVKQVYGGRQSYEIGLTDAVGATITVIIMAKGQQVLSITHHRLDDATQAFVATQRCAGPGCAGAAISVADAAGRRTITLDRVSLAGVDSLGVPLGTDDVEVRALVRADPYASGVTQPEVPNPAVCAVATDTVQVTISGEAPWTLCVQPNALELDQFYKGWYDNFDGTWTYLAGGDGTGSLSLVAPEGDGTISSLTMGLLIAETWRCADPACPGVTLTPPDSTGYASLVFTDAVLQEIDFILPSGRTAVLNGVIAHIGPDGL
ncbi:MAG: hypothetical protein KBF47_06570 [Gemmatimonadales bacterium]|nr:hypothetical protein [Gemmatimonadales bacterium]